MRFAEPQSDMRLSWFKTDVLRDSTQSEQHPVPERGHMIPPHFKRFTFAREKGNSRLTPEFQKGIFPSFWTCELHNPEVDLLPVDLLHRAGRRLWSPWIQPLRNTNGNWREMWGTATPQNCERRSDACVLPLRVLLVRVRLSWSGQKCTDKAQFELEALHNFAISRSFDNDQTDADSVWRHKKL